MSRNIKTIVTGGAGFIGSHLVEKLVKSGYMVTVLDNLVTGRFENIKQLREYKNFRFVKLDVSKNLKQISRNLKNCDWVFHLAARADIVPSIVEPKTYHKTNVDGTVNMLEAARTNNVKRFIYAASGSCYGIPKQIPTTEDADISPQYPYALTKFIGETYVLNYARFYKLPVVSLRFFNVYGPRSRTTGAYGAVFGTFLAQKLNAKPLTVVGDGKQSRDFVYVTDVANALITAAKSKVTNEVFNVGSGKEHNINYLVKLIGGEIKYIPKRPGEPDKTKADISKIKKRLGWRPKVSFEAGVKMMLENIDYWRTAPVWTEAKIQSATKEWFAYLGNG